MTHLPIPLAKRIPNSVQLELALDTISNCLARVYEQEALDHREARGDNAQLFGMKLWVHLWFELELEFDHESSIVVAATNGSFTLQVAPHSIGIYKLGDSLDDNANTTFPDDSPTKLGFGRRNADQLPLFNPGETQPVAHDERFELHDLVIGHFGNPRDGLVKWYIGAPTISEAGRQQWAWLERLPLPEFIVTRALPESDMRRFDERRPPAVKVHPKRGLDADSGSEDRIG